MSEQQDEQAEQITIEAYQNARAGVIVIRIPGITADDAMRHPATAELRGQLAVMEHRALDAERAAMDAGKANADAIQAAIRDEMARLAAEFASRGDAVFGDERAPRADVFHLCAERCRELAK